MKDQSGYTFLEMMMAFSIFSILMIAVYGTFFTQFKDFNNKYAAITMTAEANRAMKTIKEVLDDYGNITVSNNQVLSGGFVIIDAYDDGNVLGSRLNMDFTNDELRDFQNMTISQDVQSIEFILGPNQSNGIGVTDGILLVILHMEKRGVTFTLKGGVNLVR